MNTKKDFLRNFLEASPEDAANISLAKNLSLSRITGDLPSNDDTDVVMETWETKRFYVVSIMSDDTGDQTIYITDKDDFIVGGTDLYRDCVYFRSYRISSKNRYFFEFVRKFCNILNILSSDTRSSCYVSDTFLSTWLEDEKHYNLVSFLGISLAEAIHGLPEEELIEKGVI